MAKKISEYQGSSTASDVEVLLGQILQELKELNKKLDEETFEEIVEKLGDLAYAIDSRL